MEWLESHTKAMTEIREAQRTADAKIDKLVEAGRATDVRIEKLVSAVGELLRRDLHATQADDRARVYRFSRRIGMPCLGRSVTDGINCSGASDTR